MAYIRNDEEEGPTKGIGGFMKFGSGRWESFKEDYGKVRRASSEISPSRTTLGDMMRSEDHYVKITRVRRRKSFFGLSGKNTKLLGGIYASFKQAVAWRA